MDTKILSSLIKNKVLDRFDHKNLNLDVPEFKTLIPSTEHFCYVIYNILRNALVALGMDPQSMDDNDKADLLEVILFTNWLQCGLVQTVGNATF